MDFTALAAATMDKEISALLTRAGWGLVPLILDYMEANGNLKDPAPPVEDLLWDATRDPEWFIRGNAIEAAGRLDLHPERFLARAGELLEDAEG